MDMNKYASSSFMKPEDLAGSGRESRVSRRAATTSPLRSSTTPRGCRSRARMSARSFAPSAGMGMIGSAEKLSSTPARFGTMAMTTPRFWCGRSIQ
jgi:hypothetical protein